MATPFSDQIEVARQRKNRAVIILFAASGASGMMLEVVWSRMLGWLLGATTWSVMTVLIAFMGGLGLGAILWGRLAGRSRYPLRLFGLMEIAIGLYSLAMPFLFEGLGALFVMATRMVGESPAPAMAVRVLTVLLALLPPTLLMGGTLPVLARFAAEGRSVPGRTAGLLYAANTAGAVIGCFVTGCVLIYWLGVVETNVVAALVDLSVGAIALASGRRSLITMPLDDDRTSVGPAAAGGTGTAVLLIAMVSGACGLAYEVLWTRALLAAVTDDTTYAFTLMLTAFLAGHAIGAAVATRTGRNQRPHRRLAYPGNRPDPGGLDCALVDALPGGHSRPDQQCPVRGKHGILGRSHPVPSGHQPRRVRPLGRLSGSELHPRRSPLHSNRTTGRSKHRPPLWPQHLWGDRGGGSRRPSWLIPAAQVYSTR